MNCDSWLEPKELLDRRDHGARVDQRCRGDRVRVTDRHALFDDSLHADQAHAELVLQQLANGPHAAVAEVVDVVGDLLLARRVVELDQLAQEGDEVTLLQDPQLTLATRARISASSRPRRLSTL